MFYVYLLRSKKDSNLIYTGYSTNLEQRIKDHNSGKSSYTKKNMPWEIIFSCSFVEKEKALRFESYLKTSSGRAFRNKRLI